MLRPPRHTEALSRMRHHSKRSSRVIGRLFRLASELSLLLCVLTIACWIIGATQARQVRAWRCLASPQRTYFVRLDRQHLIISKQEMIPMPLPAPYAVNSTRFRHWQIKKPSESVGMVVIQNPEDLVLNPAGAGFRAFDGQFTLLTMTDASGAVFVRVRALYGAVEIPWWWMLLLFSVCPWFWLFARHRIRVRSAGGLCPHCGYDLRA